MPIKAKGIDPEIYRAAMEIPSPYYLDRGYSPEVLNRYDVGTCDSPGKPLHNRAVVPVFDTEAKTIIGFTGRSLFEGCPECKNHHPAGECFHAPKWKHTSGFQKENCLYNMWYAKQNIMETGVIVLVESPGNVWRLEEAGIHNSVAIFGAHISDAQKHLVDSSGALSIVCLLDNDEAGRKGAQKISELFATMYRLYFPSLEANDIGDMRVDLVTSDIKPLITKIGGIYN